MSTRFKNFWAIAVGVVLATALAAFFANAGHSIFSRSTPLAAGLHGAPRNSESGTKTSVGFPAVASQRPAHTGTSRPDGGSSSWAARYRTSHDLEGFVKDSLDAALKGDGRPAYYIGQAVAACASVKKIYGNTPNPEAQLSQELANMTNAPQWARDVVADRTRKCFGFLSEDPFAGLPESERAHSSAYWFELALDEHDALAQVHAATTTLAEVSVDQSLSSSTKADKLQQVVNDLNAAARSGDPDALFAAGMLAADGRYAADPLGGLAVALAACDLGHDCSADNPENVFSTCKLSASCPADADFAYFMQKSLGPEKYATAYAQAQQIEQAINTGDWSLVEKALTLGKPAS